MRWIYWEIYQHASLTKIEIVRYLILTGKFLLLYAYDYLVFRFMSLRVWWVYFKVWNRIRWKHVIFKKYSIRKEITTFESKTLNIFLSGIKVFETKAYIRLY